MKITKAPKFKLWVLLVTGLAVLLGVGFYFFSTTLQQDLFNNLHPTTQELQQRLNGGTSPNGTLSRIFYNANEADLSRDLRNVLKDQPPHHASFGIIVEETNSYSTSSAKLDGQVPVPPTEFLAATKSDGNKQLIWQPAFGVWVAIDSLTYHYGNIFGHVISGQSAEPYIVMISIYLLAAVIIWLCIAIWSYRFMLKRN
jgi:hypothetical protein